MIHRCLVALGLLLACDVGVWAADGRPLLDFTKKLADDAVATSDARFTQRDGALLISTGRKGAWPGVTLKAPGGRWDLAAFAAVAVDLKNTGPEPIRVMCRVDNPGADGQKNCVTGNVEIKPGETRTLSVPLAGAMPAELRPKLFGMRGYPNGWSEGKGIDPAAVNQVLLFVTRPKAELTFEARNLRASGARSTPADPRRLFPMIDQFGQYMHREWPGKIRSAEDFARRKQDEAADLAAHPGPDGWNQYGGWAAGPRQKATGFFRVEQIGGRWWLVDPEGRLFWSHGADCVRDSTAYTPISDREFWFAGLPPREPPLGAFYGKGSHAAHGYYQDKRFDTFNFTGANLLRKYGPEWKRQFGELAHRRLRSWGMNTVANWSAEEIYLLRKTPYTATVGARGRTRAIEGSTGYWGKFSDVFDPAFERGLRDAMAREKGKSAGDPWCLGYFVDNELSWGEELSLALAALASPADQPAKLAFMADLRQKYGQVERLNAAWGTQHASWDALLAATAPPDKQKARDDLAAFATRLAERYFEVCRDAVKSAAPQQLYLGCRFAWANDRAVRAACKFCDVVSFNRYNRSVADLRLPEGCDKPVVIGEFHFGALDRGMLHTGLVPTASQDERAAAYAAYVRSALDNRLIVGTHWFQFGDQATTGRPDGENYQIGLLDVCDTPYAETIRAVREVGGEMYRRRAGK